MIRVGVDAGGTFTDVVLIGDDGVRHERKVPSRPDDPAGLVREVLKETTGPIELVFSTTAATNALLERRGGPTKLLTTAGFEDVLEIGRQTRPELYALEPRKPEALIASEDRHGVNERVGVDGVIVALDEAELERCASLIDKGTTVAICFLHSYRAPEHEARLAAHLRARGHRVSVSSEIAPLPREYERTSTTVIDAYVAPIIDSTLAQLRASYGLRVMESSGGARDEVHPARTLLSGPAAGLVAAERLAARLELASVMALDVGGTSTDVALVTNGRAARVEELTIDGLVVALPSLGMRTVGAGGGSIAWLDAGNALKIGPQSAGASPGPAAYGRGGTSPTVTDAHVILDRLEGSICGVQLDRDAAARVVATIAAPLGVSVVEAASAIVAVADASIARAVGLAALGVSRDDLTLLAYGGASGLHAVEVARRCGIARVIVPPSPGLFCATGALDADAIVEKLVSVSMPIGEMRDRLDALESEVRRELDPTSVERLVRVRYVGQGIDGELELPSDGLDHARFEAAHRATYGYTLDRASEITGLRVRGRRSHRVQVAPTAPTHGPTRSGRYRRDVLPAELAGPALVDELSSTLWLPEASTLRLDDEGNLVITT